MNTGLHIEYSNVNQSWFLMWFDQVLRIFNEKWEAQAELDDLILNDEDISEQLKETQSWGTTTK
jgi:hypothetical protein